MSKVVYGLRLCIIYRIDTGEILAQTGMPKEGTELDGKKAALLTVGYALQEVPGWPIEWKNLELLRWDGEKVVRRNGREIYQFDTEQQIGSTRNGGRCRWCAQQTGGNNHNRRKRRRKKMERIKDDERM